jgi:hypothetical protein
METCAGVRTSNVTLPSSSMRARMDAGNMTLPRSRMRARMHAANMTFAVCLRRHRAKESNLRLVERRSLAHHPLHDSSIHVFNETMQPQTRVCLALGVETREEEAIEWVNA